MDTALGRAWALRGRLSAFLGLLARDKIAERLFGREKKDADVGHRRTEMAKVVGGQQSAQFSQLAARFLSSSPL